MTGTVSYGADRPCTNSPGSTSSPAAIFTIVSSRKLPLSMLHLAQLRPVITARGSGGFPAEAQFKAALSYPLPEYARVSFSEEDSGLVMGSVHASPTG